MTPVAFDLSGKVALVTGGSRGLGQAAAVALAEAGADVVVTDSAGRLDETLARIAAAGRRGLGVSADLARPREAVDAILARALEVFPGVDVLVNNAGTIVRAPFDEYPLEAWERTLAINLTAPFLLSQRVLPHMRARRAGKIIHVASLLSFQGGIRVCAYAASKGGLAQLTRAMANELAADGIQVNAVAPGYMETENTRALRADEERSAAILARIPAGRWGAPQDLCGAIVFLASPASDYVSGHVLTVDGGWMAR